MTGAKKKASHLVVLKQAGQGAWSKCERKPFCGFKRRLVLPDGEIATSYNISYRCQRAIRERNPVMLQFGICNRCSAVIQRGEGNE